MPKITNDQIHKCPHCDSELIIYDEVDTREAGIQFSSEVVEGQAYTIYHCQNEICEYFGTVYHYGELDTVLIEGYPI